VQLVVRSWNVFHGNADPPRRSGHLRRMIELVTADGPDVVCLQELPIWAVARIASWSGMHHFDAVARPPLWPGPLSTWVTRAHQGFFRSGLSGQANAILVAPRHAATDLGHERISEGGRERRIVHAVRIAGAPGVAIANLHASNDFVRPDVPRAEAARAAAFVEEAAAPGDVVVLAGDFAIPVTSSFPDGPPGTAVPAPEALFDVPIGWATALFLGLAAIDHLVTATAGRGIYERDLRRGINRFRWVEYSFSATLMVVLIGFYCGITSINAVIAVAGANVAMILFGWIQERMNPPGRERTTMLPFWFGTLVGIAPWVSIVVNVAGSESVPGFVYGIVVVQFVLFFSFGLNQWLQYREVGRWADYAFGEKTYLVLSLVAKSLLAWQIFGGSLAD